MSDSTYISETVSAGQLRAFIERIERVEEEIKTLNSDKSEIYKELRGCGFDVKAVRQCVAARKLDTAEREERNAIFDLYWAALTGASRVHVHEGRGDAGSSSGRIAEFDSADAGSNPAPVTIDPETGEITEHEQPETATTSPAPTHKTAGNAPREMGSEGANTEQGDVDGSTERAGHAGQSFDALTGQVEPRNRDIEIVERNTSGPDAKRAPVSQVGENVSTSTAARNDAGKRGVAAGETATNSNPQPSPLSGADKPEAVSPPAISGDLSDDDVPAFIKRDYAPKPTGDKPNCLKLKDGHCKIGFATSALCAECNAAKARVSA